MTLGGLKEHPGPGDVVTGESFIFFPKRKSTQNRIEYSFTLKTSDDKFVSLKTSKYVPGEGMHMHVIDDKQTRQ